MIPSPDVESATALPQAPPKRARFWWKLAVFALPFAVAFLFFTGTLIYSGESMPLALAVQTQLGDRSVLYFPGYGSRMIQFKVMTINARKPEIVVMGSSRGLEFRSAFFDRQAQAFYNAAGLNWQPTQVSQVLNGLAADAMPKIVLLNVDDNWFNSHYQPASFPREPNDWTTIFASNRTFMQLFASGKIIDFGALLNRRDPIHGGPALGLTAIDGGQGYRGDGSYQMGTALLSETTRQRARADALDNLSSGDGTYAPSDTVWNKGLDRLNSILQFCRQHNIQVIAFSPPYMPTVYQRMLADGKHTYIPKLMPQLKDTFARYNAPYFDFSDPATVNATDEDFFDGWHPSEQLDLRMYIQMLQAQPALLGAYSDVDFLQGVDASAKNGFEVFGP